MALKRADFPLPDLTDERTAEYFAGAARGELVLPRCDSCNRFVWYPEEECPHCGARSFTWTRVSGRGRVFTWTVVRRAFLPAFEEMVPFVTALVSLEEDPAVRIVSYIVDCDPDALAADLPVEAVFRPLRFPTVPDRSVAVPMFVPASPSREAV
ncbi:MAG TPA: OB-fold domain-containing protein [Acidimicrobiia bacterium]|nr:OB-fold domain-containing protein [Acidimicrobiia bacterium]